MGSLITVHDGVRVQLISDKTKLSELVERAVRGDIDAWDAIVDRMDNMVWSVVRSFRLSEQDSFDAAQMTWLRVVEGLHKVRDPERLGLWIATTTRRECLRVIETHKRAVPVDPDVEFSGVAAKGDVEQDEIDRQSVDRIFDGLATLSGDCQSLLRLVLCDPPMSYSEISASLGIAVGTIGPRRQRCLAQLRTASGF